jgi:GH25 family lysozyme M1 (1,4-beta-N-acetylmuramidase)
MATCRGIDISAYQAAQDWNARKAEGIVFAMAKASEGQRSRDDRFAAHIRGIKAAGLVPGAYHFGWPNQDVDTEATNYIAAVRPYAGRGFTHWLDLERYSDGRNYRGRSDQQIHDWVARWIALVAEAFPGQRVGVYASGDDLAKGHVPAGVPLWYPNYPWAGAVPYTRAEAATPFKPSGRQPLIWQFTSNPVDRDLCYLSAAQLRAWAAGTTEEEDVALTADDIDKVADAVAKKLIAAGGVLEGSDVDRIWSADVVPAARPPYNNADYYEADGKTPDNQTWTPKYALQTTAEQSRKAVALLEQVVATLGQLGQGGLADQLKSELESIQLGITVTES